jgi:hypothetical protein
MNIKIVAISLPWVIACGIIIVSLSRPSTAPSSVALSLVGYTSDTRSQSAMYIQTSPTNTRIATFLFTNGTTDHIFLYVRGSLQVMTQKGWVDDTNCNTVGDEMTPMVNPKQGERIRFPVPVGSNSWRCSVRAIDITWSPHLRPKWQRGGLELIRRAGFKLERSRTIWSPEVVRSPSCPP